MIIRWSIWMFMLLRLLETGTITVATGSISGHANSGSQMRISKGTKEKIRIQWKTMTYNDTWNKRDIQKMTIITIWSGKYICIILSASLYTCAMRTNDGEDLIKWVYLVHTRDYDLKQALGWWNQGQPAEAVTSNEKRATRAQWAIKIGSQHYHVPYSGTIMDPNTYPTSSSQSSSPPFQVICTTVRRMLTRSDKCTWLLV